MSVFYKFKSALTFDTIQFDDLHISLQEFKKAVIQRSQPGKNTNFDLQVTNAETNEVYSDDNALIPKNSSLIVVRIPLSGTSKKAWDTGDHVGSKIGVISSDYLQENPGSIVVKSADLAALNASEEDKIKAMMFQSNVDYDPANYSRMKGGIQKGDPPPSYICHKCDHPGHWIKDCPITVVPDIKKSSGIPQSFMTPVEDASVPGALMTPTGTFAVPTIDMHAYKEGKKEKPFSFSEEAETSSKPIIPEDLLCTICQDILTEAVMMPCCGNSFCDECIRNILIESEENQCPDCKEKDTSPETLIPNRFLRNAVNTFRNKTGYRGGGHRVKRNEREAAKSPSIDQDHDVEIIGTIPVEPVKKIESEPVSEKGSAIVVLGADVPGPHLRAGNWIPTNGSQKLPIIHVEHRAPLGRPKMAPDGLPPDSSRPHGNGVRSSPDAGGDSERKRSSPLSHLPPVVNRLPQIPNTSQLPPGYNPSTLPPMSASYGEARERKLESGRRSIQPITTSTEGLGAEI